MPTSTTITTSSKHALNTPLTGQIVAAFGRQYLVKLPDGEAIACVPRGKKSEAVCGDHVEMQRTAAAAADQSTGAQGVIDRILPRSSLLHRSDAFREKLIAANVTQIVVVVASEPSFSDELLARCLIAAEDQDLDVLIVLNKCDLAVAAAAARTRLQPYRDIGYRIMELTALDTAAPLLPLLHGHQSVLVGQSGMGKSTLINSLLPNAQAATREISTALDSGKHTTTHAKLYRLDEKSTLIDCPGVQAFGLHHLDAAAIAAGFIEFTPYRGQCRFYNCRHQMEPGCALTGAVQEGRIDARRLQLFQSISGAQK